MKDELKKYLLDIQKALQKNKFIIKF